MGQMPSPANSSLKSIRKVCLCDSADALVPCSYHKQAKCLIAHMLNESAEFHEDMPKGKGSNVAIF